MAKVSRFIQNVLIAFIMASSVTSWYNKIDIDLLHLSLLNIPIMWMLLFVASYFTANDVRVAFQKVLWFQKREDPLPIWQVGIGMIFYFAQVAYVEQFARNLMSPNLGGMPLYLVISFLNAFLITVIYQEIFYEKNKQVAVPSKTDQHLK